MIEVVAGYIGDSQFEVAARGHRLMCDQPAEIGGWDEGMTPPELLLASLSTCAAYYAAQFLKARELCAEGLQVRVTAEKAVKPARLARFLIYVMVPGLEARYQEGLLRAVKACLIHNTLTGGPEIGVTIGASPATIEWEATLATES
jgi:uncharacterized OsmC-like protein